MRAPELGVGSQETGPVDEPGENAGQGAPASDAGVRSGVHQLSGEIGYDQTDPRNDYGSS